MHAINPPKPKPVESPQTAENRPQTCHEARMAAFDHVFLGIRADPCCPHKSNPAVLEDAMNRTPKVKP